MDFAPTPRAQELADRFRRFVDAEVVPLEPRFLAEAWETVSPALEAVRAKARGLGLWAPTAPQELGGMGLDLLTYAAVAEQLGRSPLGTYAVNAQAPDAGNMELLAAHADPAQRARWLAPLVAGTMRSCFALTEPGAAGSDPTLITSRARRDGDGWVLDGRKWFTTGFCGAGLAVVAAVTDPEAPPRGRSSLFLVPAGTPGLAEVRKQPLMGERGSGWHSHSELALDGCRVGADALLGAAGAGFKLVQARLGPGRIHHCMRWLGVAARSYDMMCGRARERSLGEAGRLADQQLVQAAVAESAAELRAARWLVLEAAWRMDRGGADAARTEVSLAKFHVAGVLQRVVDRALQVHGGLGMLDDTVLAFFYRTERAARIYDGPDEVHKLAAGRRLLRSG